MKKAARIAGWILFALYLAALLRLTVFRPGRMPAPVLNLTPFAEWGRTLAQEGPVRFCYLFFGNIVWFVPLGWALAARGVRLRWAALAGFGLSFGIELGQFLLRTGVSEVDDLLLNTLGAVLGWCAAALWRRWRLGRALGRLRRSRWRWLFVGVCLAALAAALVLCKAVRPNLLFARQWPVKGVDVSEYQGRIDWPALAGQSIRFAFIKATEGSSSADPAFAHNRRGAAEAGIAVGAYHFFSFDSPGATQAENFLAALGGQADALPPVVDVELYGSYVFSPKPAGEVRRELRVLLAALENATGRKPILYATGRARRLYLAQGFGQYPLWLRSVYLPPAGEWLFWQYTDRGRLPGYSGPERFIDLNAFCGGEQAWAQFLAAGAA